MARTVWLASYPKSGSTWFRIFLANLLHPEMAPVDINRLPLPANIASSRVLFDDLLGIPSALLTPAEVAGLRPAADQELNHIWDRPLLLRKVHDAYTWLTDGRPLLGQAPNFSAVYILRDPWDVAVSMTSHFRYSLEDAVEDLCNPNCAISNTRNELGNQFVQSLLNWEGHALSWLTAPLPLHVVRYEMMHQEPLPTFRGAVRFLGFDHNDQAIEAALNACSFQRLQAQEKDKRFRESLAADVRFFRNGQVGEGRKALTVDQLQRLETMRNQVELAITSRQQLA